MAQHWKQDTLTSGLSKGWEAGDAGMGRQGAKAGTVPGARSGGRLGVHTPQSLEGSVRSPQGLWWLSSEQTVVPLMRMTKGEGAPSGGPKWANTHLAPKPFQTSVELGS